MFLNKQAYFLNFGKINHRAFCFRITADHRSTSEIFKESDSMLFPKRLTWATCTGDTTFGRVFSSVYKSALKAPLHRTRP